MSYIDEFRERFLAAEQRFGRINEAGREYRDRLMGLMSRIEEEIRCRRDVEQQQAKEIERLSGEVDRISGENEQLRTMMMSLLTAVEAGDTDQLGGTLNDMDTKVAALIGEGQGSATAAPLVDVPAEMTGKTPDFSTELADEFTDEADEGEAFSPPSFPAGDMMPLPEDNAEADHGDDAGSEEMVAEEAATADETPQVEDTEAEAPEAEEEDMSVTADDAPAAEADFEFDAKAEAPSESLDAGEPMQANAASEMAAFYGSDDDTGADVDAVPAYSHAVAGWEDFLDEEEVSPEAPADNAQSALSEVSGDHVAEDTGDAEAGSIHELIDRVKTVVDSDDAAGDETANLDAANEAGEGEDDGGKAAAQ